jgi:hypothetical protein
MMPRYGRLLVGTTSGGLGACFEALADHALACFPSGNPRDYRCPCLRVRRYDRGGRHALRPRCGRLGRGYTDNPRWRQRSAPDSLGRHRRAREEAAFRQLIQAESSRAGVRQVCRRGMDEARPLRADRRKGDGRRKGRGAAAGSGGFGLVVSEIRPRTESAGSGDLRTRGGRGRGLPVLGYGPMLRRCRPGNTGTRISRALGT